MSDDVPEGTHRTTVDWLGEPVLTLAHLWPAGRPRAAVVGLLDPPGPGRSDYEEAALGAGVGLVDLVRRPTCHERHLSRRELDHGREALLAELEARDVPLLVSLFRRPVEILLGDPGRPGLQERTTSWGARLFRMPGPFTSAPEARLVMEELRAELGAARR